MNTVIEPIKKRLTVRSYESKPIPKDIINMIIDAKMEGCQSGWHLLGTLQRLENTSKSLSVVHLRHRKIIVQVIGNQMKRELSSLLHLELKFNISLL